MQVAGLMNVNAFYFPFCSLLTVFYYNSSLLTVLRALRRVDQEETLLFLPFLFVLFVRLLG